MEDIHESDALHNPGHDSNERLHTKLTTVPTSGEQWQWCEVGALFCWSQDAQTRNHVPAGGTARTLWDERAGFV